MKYQMVLPTILKCPIILTNNFKGCNEDGNTNFDWFRSYEDNGNVPLNYFESYERNGNIASNSFNNYVNSMGELKIFSNITRMVPKIILI